MAGKPIRRGLVVLGLGCLLLFGEAQRAEAFPDLGGALGDLISGILVLPASIIQGTLSGPPIIGTLGGALGGALNAVALTTRGALRLVGVAVPVAMQAAPYVLPFVL